MSKTDVPSGFPRAMIHKKILDVAESKPDASLETIATEVSGASVGLVDRVLAEYGDPAESPEQFNANDSMTETEYTNGQQTDALLRRVPDLRNGALSDEQRETLRFIHERPDASQRDIADALGVSQSTVNHRLNAIEGFEWDRRQAFSELIFAGVTDAQNRPGNAPESDRHADVDRLGERVDTGERPADQVVAVEGITERIDALERRFDDAIEELQRSVEETNHPASSPNQRLSGQSPELVQKVMHACLESELVDEAEELRVIGMLTGNAHPVEDH